MTGIRRGLCYFPPSCLSFPSKKTQRRIQVRVMERQGGGGKPWRGMEGPNCHCDCAKERTEDRQGSKHRCRHRLCRSPAAGPSGRQADLGLPCSIHGPTHRHRTQRGPRPSHARSCSPALLPTLPGHTRPGHPGTLLPALLSGMQQAGKRTPTPWGARARPACPPSSEHAAKPAPHAARSLLTPAAGHGPHCCTAWGQPAQRGPMQSWAWSNGVSPPSS